MSSGPNVPTLLFPALAAARRGARIHRLNWTAPAELSRNTERRGPWVASHVRPKVGALVTSPRPTLPLIIGASFGARAAPIAADFGLPGVWIMPPLTEDDWVISALARSEAPFLLIGGGEDPAWDLGIARSLTPHVLEIEGADHALMHPGPIADSVATLGRVVARIERFLDETVWPGAGRP
ncbi:MAG: hypothetical protein QM635_08975 [Microbacteriaceae bacterium]